MVLQPPYLLLSPYVCLDERVIFIGELHIYQQTWFLIILVFVKPLLFLVNTSLTLQWWADVTMVICDLVTNKYPRHCALYKQNCSFGVVDLTTVQY